MLYLKVFNPKSKSSGCKNFVDWLKLILKFNKISFLFSSHRHEQQEHQR